MNHVSIFANPGKSVAWILLPLCLCVLCGEKKRRDVAWPDTVRLRPWPKQGNGKNLLRPALHQSWMHLGSSRRLVKIRATQVKAAVRATQLAPVLIQLRRAVRTILRRILPRCCCRRCSRRRSLTVRALAIHSRSLCKAASYRAITFATRHDGRTRPFVQPSNRARVALTVR